jgi:hypothetical protein
MMCQAETQVLVAHSGMHPMLDAVEQSLDVCGDGLQLLEDYKFNLSFPH